MLSGVGADAVCMFARVCVHVPYIPCLVVLLLLGCAGSGKQGPVVSVAHTQKAEAAEELKSFPGRAFVRSTKISLGCLRSERPERRDVWTALAVLFRTVSAVFDSNQDIGGEREVKFQDSAVRSLAEALEPVMDTFHFDFDTLNGHVLLPCCRFAGWRK